MEMDEGYNLGSIANFSYWSAIGWNPESQTGFLELDYNAHLLGFGSAQKYNRYINMAIFSFVMLFFFFFSINIIWINIMIYCENIMEISIM